MRRTEPDVVFSDDVGEQDGSLCVGEPAETKVTFKYCWTLFYLKQDEGFVISSFFRDFGIRIPRKTLK